jgi:hypothetical protein
MVALLVALAPRAGGAAPSAADTRAALDRTLEAAWRKAHVRPAPPVDDARFLRRIYLDLWGAVPPPAAVIAFAADRTPDKRARAVDALLDSPRYADHFTDYWDKVLLGRQLQGQLVDRAVFRRWLHEQLEKNAGWDRWAQALIASTGQNSAGGPKSPKAAAPVDDSVLNGAVNWILKYAQNPQDLTGKYARVFLGVHIQCAQCHDHPSEKWTQEDFRRLAACFARSGPQQIDTGKVMGIRRVRLLDAEKPVVGGPPSSELRAIATAVPRALDGTDFASAGSRRVALADWTVHNRGFSRALVNRYWAYFLGRGFVEPIDDFRRSNPTTLPAALDRLADDFAANEYDLKYLIRVICTTRAYQLSAGGRDNRLWADYRLRPLGPEELLEAVAAATDLEAILRRVGGGGLDALPGQLRNLVTFLFDVDEELDPDEFAGTIPQALMLINGTLINYGVSARPGSALAEVLAMPVGDEQKIEALYVRALSRRPTAAELKRWTAFVSAPRERVLDVAPSPAPSTAKGNDPLARIAARMKPYPAGPREQAYEDMFWALLNSSEFMFRH